MHPIFLNIYVQAKDLIKDRKLSPLEVLFVQDCKVALQFSEENIFHVIWQNEYSGHGHRWPTKLTLFLLYFWRSCSIWCSDFEAAQGTAGSETRDGVWLLMRLYKYRTAQKRYALEKG